MAKKYYVPGGSRELVQQQLERYKKAMREAKRAKDRGRLPAALLRGFQVFQAAEIRDKATPLL